MKAMYTSTDLVKILKITDSVLIFSYLINEKLSFNTTQYNLL